MYELTWASGSLAGFGINSPNCLPISSGDPASVATGTPFTYLSSPAPLLASGKRFPRRDGGQDEEDEAETDAESSHDGSPWVIFVRRGPAQGHVELRSSGLSMAVWREGGPDDQEQDDRVRRFLGTGLGNQDIHDR